MARQIRKKSGTGIYHVMLRGINRQDIFEDDEDYLQMTSILRGQSERYDEKGLRLPPFCTFYAYCLMSNHLHLLIQEREDNISDIVKRIGVTYAHYFNKKYERNGHLFQDRFRSEPVDDIGYFITLLRYIHQNPLKASEVNKMITRTDPVILGFPCIRAREACLFIYPHDGDFLQSDNSSF